MTPPDGLDASRLPVWSGYIAMNGSDGSSLSLPYQGVTGSMTSQTVLDPDNTYLTTSASSNYDPVTEDNPTFLLPASNATATDATVYPEAAISLAFGSALVRCDVHPVGPYGQHKAAKGKKILGVKSLGKIHEHRQRPAQKSKHTNERDQGNIYGFPYRYAPRGGVIAAWDGMLEDGESASGIFSECWVY